MGAQGALPVDAAGNPWLGSYVYNSGNLVLDLLYNLMLESTGRLQKCRIYEMTDNKTARSTIAYLIVRDQAHENAFAKALESLGVNWGAALPIPKTNAEQFPEVKKLLDLGLQSIQYTFSADDESQAAKLYRGASPSNDGTELSTAVMPEGFPMTIAPERREEFAPGLDKELLALIQATAEVEIATNGAATHVVQWVGRRLRRHPPICAGPKSSREGQLNDRHPEGLRSRRQSGPDSRDRHVDPRDTDHPTGTEQAAENAATESPS